MRRESVTETGKVKNYLIGGLMCLVAALVFGVKPVQREINEAMRRGTVGGVESCMAYSRSELLSIDAVKATCVRNFQKNLYNSDNATGRAGPRLDLGTVSWGGRLENKTPDHVTTWVRLSVSIFDEDGSEQEFTAETSIWIDPLGEAEFKVEIPELQSEQLEDKDFCDHDDPEPTGCMAWGVTDVMGLSI